MPVQTQILTRRGAAATWTSTNPTLGAGEIGFESDTNKFKIGTGSTAWVSLPYASNVSPLTTKGDLYTYSTDNARLAVGANGETLVADSSTTTGLRWQGDYAAGKNKIINGDFNINQRNLFTFSNPAGAILADRFQFNNFQSGTNTASIETFTLGTAPVAGYESKYFARATNSGATATNTASIMQQRIESVRTFANQTATISFWAKADSAGVKVAVELAQNFGTGGSPSTAVNTYAGQVTISTSWARYSVTIAIPSISGKTLGTNNNDYLGLNLWSSAGSDFNSRTGSLGIQNNIFDFWGVQIEAGSVATAFQTATGTLQGELAACQRYYYQFATGTQKFMGNPVYYATTSLWCPVSFPVTMRTAPALVASSGTNFYRNDSASAPPDYFNSLTIYQPSTTGAFIYNATEALGTAGFSGIAFTDNADASIAFNSEL